MKSSDQKGSGTICKDPTTLLPMDNECYRKKSIFPMAARWSAAVVQAADAANLLSNLRGKVLTC
jgi:hypothetical protein